MKLFGTDGIRGIANIELTPELAFKTGFALGNIISEGKKEKAKVIIGTDTRLSADMLEAGIVSGLCSAGADAICVGVIPTPAVAYLTRFYDCDAGIVISASHNPHEYNGIKIFNKTGYKLPDEIEERIENMILEDSISVQKATGQNIGKKTVIETALDDYIKFAKSTVKDNLEGLNIVVDCANGAAYKVAPITLFEMGAKVFVINNEPDGININLGCGSTHMSDLQNSVKQNKADIGIAFDGDGDRLLAVDENGEIVDGDQIMAICAMELWKNNQLRHNTFVSTVMSNLGLDIFAKENGLNIVKSKVGDKHVLEEMLNKGLNFGGEQSGHIIFLDYNTTGDGLVTALQLLSILKNSGNKLSELASIIKILPQVLVNARVSESKKAGYLEDSEIAKEIEKLEEEFKDMGRILIRPSGTEPIIRVMIEGEDKEYIKSRAIETAALIEKRLGK